MGLLVLLLIIINITATYIIRSVLCSKSFASKDRNRNIKIIGRFNLIKFPICLISSIYITYYFSQVLHSNSLILKLSTAYITFVLVNIDAIIMYRPVKEIRLLEINLFTYMKSTVVENIMIFIPWCLAVLVRDIIPNNSKDSYFFVFYFMVWGIYIIIQPFLTRFVLNAKRISIDENKIIGEDLNRN